MIKFSYKFNCCLRLQFPIKISTFTNFEILIVRLHVLHILNTNIKFWVNQMLFTIEFINWFFITILDYKNYKFKHLINDITLDLWFFGNFVIMKNIRKKCNIMVDLLKLTSHKKILSRVVSLRLQSSL